MQPHVDPPRESFAEQPHAQAPVTTNPATSDTQIPDVVNRLPSASTFPRLNEETPLLPSHNLQEETPVEPTFPKLLGQHAGPLPEIHSRFGFRAFFDDVRDLQSGTIPVSFFIAAVIGCLCGVASYLYYTLLEFLLDLLWRRLPEFLTAAMPFWLPSLYWLWIPFVGMICAVLVGVAIKTLGFPGDLAYTVKCVHKMGYVPMSHTPSMIAASQLSILGGGSLGPEAPLVAICASIAGWVSITLFKQKYKNVVRKHTLCGMACALAAFFGVPLGGSLFALEINSRLGHEYFEHALQAIASGTICLVVFRSMAGLPIGPVYFFTKDLLKDSSAAVVCVGAVLGLVGALIAAAFAHFHWTVVKKLKDNNITDPVNLSILGGIGVCALGVLVPHTLFWGEFEMQTIGSLSPASALPHVWPTTGLTGFEITGFFSAVIVGVCKLIAISFTVAGGYRGGFIFPFFVAGAAFGRATTFLFPTIPPVIAILSLAAGINVTITRTALATPLILCGLAGEINATPAVLAASLVAVFVTYYMVRFDRIQFSMSFCIFSLLFDLYSSEAPKC